ncbi:MAG: hypothetical protein ACRYG8_54040 [Janthinobacterium lividum]
MKACRAVTATVLAWLAAGSAHASDPYARYDDHGTAGLTQVTGTSYVNNNYGYAITLPVGQAAWMDKPPSPNHGARIFLGPQRSIEVDASFDSALLGSTGAVAEDAAGTEGGHQAGKSPDELGHQTAERVSVVGPGDRRRIVVARWADQGSQGDPINYTVSLETTDAAFKQDKHIFDGIVSSFHYVPRQP